MNAENAVSGTTGAKFSIVEKSENIVPVLKKINAMHLDILKADWEKDKMYTAGANRPAYAYLSSDKLKQNISPILAKHGVVALPLVDNLSPRPPVGNMTTHWTLDYSMMVADSETGSYIIGRVIGEAADSGDKALGKATTSGNKLFWFNLFQIADGIDSEAAPAERVSLEGKGDLARANSLKPTAQAPAAAPAAQAPATPAAAPKAAAPAAAPVAKAPAAAPKAAAPKAAVPKAAPVAKVPAAAPAPAPVETPAEAPATEEPAEFVLNIPGAPMGIKNTIEGIVKAHPEFAAEAAELTSIPEATDFIARH